MALSVKFCTVVRDGQLNCVKVGRCTMAKNVNVEDSRNRNIRRVNEDFIAVVSIGSLFINWIHFTQAINSFEIFASYFPADLFA